MHLRLNRSAAAGRVIKDSGKGFDVTNTSRFASAGSG